MPKSLEQYAKDSPIKGQCRVCKQRLADQKAILDELNAGLLAGFSPTIIVNWLQVEHGMTFPRNDINNHLRGLRDNPERHNG